MSENNHAGGGASRARTDPYLQWAQATGFRNYRLVDGAFVAVALECLQGQRVGDLEKSVKAAIAAGHLSAGDVVFLPLYLKKFLPKSLADIRFCTARVRQDKLDIFGTLVKRFELGLAVQPQHDFLEAGTFRSKGKGPLIGLIDDQFAYANRAFAKSNGTGTSRFVALWSQGQDKPSSEIEWQPCPGGYGHLTLPATLIAQARMRSYRYGIQRRFTHGTHVGSLAAGCDVAADFAGQAEIVGVQFPREALEDTSGGAMSVHVLDAIHFILAVGSPKLSTNPKDLRPVVINLSYGTYAGAHDGTSILEAAMDELIAIRRGRLEIVVPAGNQHESRSHAELDLSVSRRLKWQVLPDDGTPSFMELWIAPEDAGNITIQVTSPSGLASNVVARGKSWDSPGANWGVFFPEATTGSDMLTGALIALAPTRRRDRGDVWAEHGIWVVDIGLAPSTVQPKAIRVWVERDDFLTGFRRNGRQSYLLDARYRKYRDRYGQPGDDERAVVKRQGAFNTIATGARTVVVGGYVRSSGVMAPYSANAGVMTGSRLGPDLAAPSETSETIHGIRGSASMGVDTVRIGGTSIAAPQATRRIVNWMHKAQADQVPDWDSVILGDKLGDDLPERPEGPPYVPREGKWRLP